MLAREINGFDSQRHNLVIEKKKQNKTEKAKSLRTNLPLPNKVVSYMKTF